MTSFLTERGVTRLCHFTGIDNLPSIARHGIVPRDALAAIGADRSARDPERLDGFLGHVSCSIEVPNIFVMNAMYPEKRRVVFLLAADLVSRRGTLCAPGNAAKAFGSRVTSASTENVARLYADSVGRWTRRVSHVPRCPTDLQAEVLIEGPIPLSSVLGVVADVSDLRCAQDADRIVRFANEVAVPLFTCPAMFDEDALREAVRGGRAEELSLENVELR